MGTGRWARTCRWRQPGGDPVRSPGTTALPEDRPEAPCRWSGRSIRCRIPTSTSRSCGRPRCRPAWEGLCQPGLLHHAQRQSVPGMAAVSYANNPSTYTGDRPLEHRSSATRASEITGCTRVIRRRFSRVRLWWPVRRRERARTGRSTRRRSRRAGCSRSPTHTTPTPGPADPRDDGAQPDGQQRQRVRRPDDQRDGGLHNNPAVTRVPFPTPAPARCRRSPFHGARPTVNAVVLTTASSTCSGRSGQPMEPAVPASL